MKRFWFGVALLAALLVGSFLGGKALGDVHESLARYAEQAADLAEAGDRAGAGALIDQAAQVWKKRGPTASAFADHEPLEEMDYLLAEARVYCDFGRDEDLIATCRRLAGLSRDVAETHQLHWWSLL